MSKIIIRPCTHLDLFFVYKSFIECFRDPLGTPCFARRPKSTFGALMFFIKNFRSIKNPEILMYIVGINGKKIGFVRAKANKEDKKTIGHSICIREKYRRKGIGSVVTSLFFNTLKIEGVKEFVALILLENEISIKFHKKRGFVENGRDYLVHVKLDKIERIDSVEVAFSKYIFHKLLAFFFCCSTLSIKIDDKVRRVILVDNHHWRIQEPVETWEEMRTISTALKNIDTKIKSALFVTHNLKLFPMNKIKCVRTFCHFKKKLI